MTPAGRNRVLLVTALGVASAALALISFGNIGDNLVYYWSADELLSQGSKAVGPTIRLGGVVQAGSVQWNEERTQLTFRVGSSRIAGTPAVTVSATEIPPQMFREGIGVVVEGHYEASGIFRSKRLMVNHSNEYRSPHDGGVPAGWKSSVQ